MAGSPAENLALTGSWFLAAPDHLGPAKQSSQFLKHGSCLTILTSLDNYTDQH